MVAVLTGFYFFAFSWGAWLVMKRGETHQVKPPINNRILLFLILFPVLLVVVASFLGGVSIKDRWAIPVWFALPIYMANQLVGRVGERGANLTIIRRFWLVFITLIGVAFSYTLLGSFNYLSKHQDYAEAREEMVQTVAKRFAQVYPNQSISWVGGTIWPDHIAPLAFYLPNHPRALPGFPNQKPALINPHPTWHKEYGVIICGRRIDNNQGVMDQCVEETRKWLYSMQREVKEESISFRAKGWRWGVLLAPERQVKVFWIAPIALQNSALPST